MKVSFTHKVSCVGVGETGLLPLDRLILQCTRLQLWPKPKPQAFPKPNQQLKVEVQKDEV